MNSAKPKPWRRPGKTVADAPLARIAPTIAAMAIAFISFCAFLPALANQFVNWDDYENIVDNMHYRGLGWSELRWMFTTFQLGPYQPLSWLSFAFDYLVWGTNPLGYHLTNLVLHALNAVLLFFLARLLLARALTADHREISITLGAALASLLFSLHPLRVESVVWATERRDVLSGFFYFLTLYAYVTIHQAGQRRIRRVALIIFFYILSLLAKATAVTLPAVLLLLDVYPLRRLPGTLSAWTKPNYRAILWEKLPYLCIAAVFALLALFGQENAGALKPVQQYFLSYRLGQAFYAVCFYVWKTLLPLHLSPLYELPFDFDAWMPLFYLCGFTALVLTAVLYKLRKRWPALLASWLYYVIVLLPVSGLAQSGRQLVADRYSYLSCVSWALLAGGGLGRYWISSGGSGARIKTASAVAALVLLSLGAMSWQQSKVWRDTKTLWLRVVTVTPWSSVANYNIGRTYEDEGKLTESLSHYRRAVEINPANADAQYNLARLLAKGGKVAEAIEGYRRVLAVRPNDAEAHNNLGLLMGRQGDLEAAMTQLHLALKIDPKYGKAYFNMGRLFADRGESEQALSNYRKALELDPDQPEILLAMADALVRLRRFDEAALQLQKVVALKPNSPDAHTALARVLVAQGRKSEAEGHYREALRLLKPRERPAN